MKNHLGSVFAVLTVLFLLLAGVSADPFWSIVAWGRNDYGQCNVPSPNESFVALAVGDWHSLGLNDCETSVEEDPTSPDVLRIISIQPNPFTLATSVSFQSPGLESVLLEVFDVTGRLVDSREMGILPGSDHITLWDGRGSAGAELLSGIYIIALHDGVGQSAFAKVVLVR